MYAQLDDFLICLALFCSFGEHAMQGHLKMINPHLEGRAF